MANAQTLTDNRVIIDLLWPISVLHLIWSHSAWLFADCARLLFSHNESKFWFGVLKDFVHCADQARWPWVGKEVIFWPEADFACFVIPMALCDAALEGRVNTNWVEQFIFGLWNRVLHPDYTECMKRCCFAGHGLGRCCQSWSWHMCKAAVSWLL